MSARERDSVERSPCSDSQMTYTEFLRQFPDNDACLDYLKARFYPDGTPCPKCEKPTKFHRIKGRSAYGCQFCGHQVYPTSGTIFHKSTTSLQLWFWAIYLMSSTRCGISAKQLGREIGVGYKTAWRMFNRIRSLLSDLDDGMLSGDVEADETSFGGKPRGSRPMGKSEARTWAHQKPTVFAMVERGGRVRAMIVPDRGGPELKGQIREHVLPDSMIYTDEWKLYRGLEKEYRGHRRIMHRQKIYAIGDTHTQTVEGFFGLFKTGVRGVYHSISTKWLQSYIDEYSFRYNRRKSEQPMFWAILDRVQKDRLAAS